MGKFIRRLILFLLATALSFALAEGVWRLLRVPRLGPLNNPTYMQYDSLLGWRGISGAKAVHRDRDFQVEITINAHGFRDRERSLKKSTGMRRILALGDSLTFGFGVNGAEAYPARIESGLKETSTEVLNLGVCGYGTDQQYLLLREYGMDFEPDVILVMLCGNDIEEILRERMYGRPKPRFTREPEGLRLANVPVPYPFLERYSELYRSFRKHLWMWRRGPLTPDETRVGRQIQRQLLLKITRLAIRHRAATVVCQTTSDFQLPDRTEGYHRLDLAPLFIDRPDLIFAHDRHWNAKGHAIVAERIVAFLRHRGLVSP